MSKGQVAGILQSFSESQDKAEGDLSLCPLWSKGRIQLIIAGSTCSEKKRTVKMGGAAGGKVTLFD